MPVKKLWTYYHAQPKCNVNASLYDIREHFQGRNDKGKMNNKSNDETYNGLITNLRSALKALAVKIEPKVYEYGFLKKSVCVSRALYRPPALPEVVKNFMLE